MKRCQCCGMGLLVLAFVLSGCGGPSRGDKTATPPAKPKTEGDLAFVIISKKAYKVHSQPFPAGQVQETLPLTGWIMAKQGREATLTAPVAGYVRAIDNNLFPARGEKILDNQQILSIEPVLSPVEDVQIATLKRGVDGEVRKAQKSLKVARDELKRIAGLFKDGLKGQQELDLAKLKFEHAKEDLHTAQAKQKLFENTSRPKTILAPRGWTIIQVHVGPGQFVSAAAPLVTVVDLDPVWIRVPVPEFDVPHVNSAQAARVTLKYPPGTLPPGQDAPRFTARPLTGKDRVSLVPQVDRDRHTADLLYELDKGKEKVTFVKDQMVTVHVPLGKKSKETVVPYSAIVFDAFGGAWVYLEIETKGDEIKFQRRRVEVGSEFPVQVKAEGKEMKVEGVVIRVPPDKEGGAWTLADTDHVVFHGAAKLYSAEFHSPPVNRPETTSR